jgi:hypothetical protein
MVHVMAACKASVCLFLLLNLAVGEVKVPPIWPQIQGVFPRGGQRGTEVALTIVMKRMVGPTELESVTSTVSR